MNTFSSSSHSLITNLKDWQPLIDQGLCLVPTSNNGVPVEAWSKYERPYGLNELYDIVDKKNATSLEIVCGYRSGGLIVIDVDTKYKEGFDADLFGFMRVYDWFSRLVIDKTPSGGYHLYFKVAMNSADGSDSGVVGCLKVCKRKSTEEELSLAPKEKTKCFLEIKGEGGLSRCYPAHGYTRTQSGTDGEYPTLSYQDFRSILSLCESFNEDIVEVKPPKIAKSQDDWYIIGENPFDSYNLSYQGGLLEEQGWTLQTETGGYKRYSKVGRKNKDIDATYNISRKFYKIHAANCGIEIGTYNPVTLLCTLRCWDKKECWAWLVKEGYGRLKPEREKRIIQNRVESNIPLPSNISAEGKKEYERLIEEHKSEFPYGVFWDTNDLTGVSEINRDSLYKIAGQLGFRICGGNNDIVKLHGHIIENVTERVFFDTLSEYIGSGGQDIVNVFEKFVQNSGKFTIGRIPILDETCVLSGTKNRSYKGYRNGYLVIDVDEVSLESYDNLDKYIWKHQIQDRDFSMAEDEPEAAIMNCLYYKFIEKAIVGGLNEHTKKVIGYYSHDFKSTSSSYAVILCENCENPKHGGGAGKNVFTNLFAWTTGLLNKPAKNVKFDDTLLRTWNPSKRILSLNDADRKFDYMSLKEYISGEGEVGKKFKQEVTISNREMPKFIINTNFSFDPSLAGLKRRLPALEFTNFFIRAGGVDVYFKKDFPDADLFKDHDWTTADFIGFDWIIVRSIQEFLRGGCKLSFPQLSDGGWAKQFDQRFMVSTLMFIREYMPEWLQSGGGGEVLLSEFNKQYESFCYENNISKEYRLSGIKMNEALEEYCAHNGGIEFEPNVSKRYNGIVSKVKVFRTVAAVEADITEFGLFDNETGKEEDMPF